MFRLITGHSFELAGLTALGTRRPPALEEIAHVSEIETDGNGHYWRDRTGVWRYALSGEPVPGGRDRRPWDGVHTYPTCEVQGSRYVVVPAWHLSEYPYLASRLANPATLAEEVGGALSHYLVPEFLWEPPEERHPDGGMWAPELAPELLMEAPAFAAAIGYQDVTSIWEQISRGAFPAPVLYRTVRSRRRGYWTRPIVELWAAGYRARLAPSHTAQAEKRRERLARLAELGRRPIPPASRRPLRRGVARARRAPG
jgi:hypothetical protein